VNLVAVDLSTSGISSLPRDLFRGCAALTAVVFPSQLVEICMRCFYCCAALIEVDLSNTQVTDLVGYSFCGSGAARVSLPATLNRFDATAFGSTPLRVLDLRVCAGVTTTDCVGVLEA
jgi:hypothetical protein